MRKPLGRPTAKRDESWLKDVQRAVVEVIVEVGGGGHGRIRSGSETLMR
jgi:hypothetical protein